jgi:hypothetical protein
MSHVVYITSPLTSSRLQSFMSFNRVNGTLRIKMVDNYGTVQFTLEKDLKGQTHMSLTSGFFHPTYSRLKLTRRCQWHMWVKYCFPRQSQFLFLGLKDLWQCSSPIVGHDLIMSSNKMRALQVWKVDSAVSTVTQRSKASLSHDSLLSITPLSCDLTVLAV